jgi:anti-sigma B factor antagonist
MNESTTNGQQGVYVGRLGTRVFVRVAGRGTFQNSQPLRRFALEMIDRGQREFTLDLGPCQGMDSTFLGVLAGLGLRLRHEGVPQRDGIQIINISPRNRELLVTLGLDRLFTIFPDGAPPHFPPGEDPKLEQLPGTNLATAPRVRTIGETASMMLDAHQDLIRADKSNEARFKDVTDCLRQEIERQKTNK